MSTCGTCGEPHDPKRCDGHSKRTGRQCGRPAGAGTDHPGYGNCKHHFGATSNGRKHAARTEARELANAYGVPEDIDPGVALLEVIARAYGSMKYLLAKVQEIDPDALVWGTTDQVDKQATEFPGVDTTRSATPNAWLELYREERSFLAKVCTDALRVGIEERRIRLQERQGEWLADALRELSKAWGVPDTPETWQQARAALEVVDGGLAS